MTSAQLPVAGVREVRRAAARLIAVDRRAFVLVVVLNVLATLAGLAGPWLLGRIIDTVTSRGTTGRVDRLAALILVAALLQLALTRLARWVGARFGERTSARIREGFVHRALRLPASLVDRVPTGDLTARAVGDVGAVAASLRDAGPDILIAALQVALVLVAVVGVHPLLGLCAAVALVGAWWAVRWYLARARTAYLAQGAANSALAEVLSATAAGARTVEALGLQQHRIRAGAEAIDHCRETRLQSLRLRTVLYPAIDVSAVLPLVAVLLVGGALYDSGRISLGAVVTAALYLRQLSGPLEVLELWIDQLQSSAASFARLEGLGTVPGRPPTRAVPRNDQIVVDRVSFAYDPGRDVLHEVDLAVRPGERLAIVGPSGAGKTTLGRLLAGIDDPRTGSVTVGGVPVAQLPPEELRRQVLLVTQEQHVFADTVAGNLGLARPSATDAELRAALAAVDASWVDELPDGLDTGLGPDGQLIDGAQAQQLALARVVLADPHTLVLDEATALLDPTTARHTERTLSAVLRGRTVVAIAHRLHTAHDADRVAVMEAGRIVELGSHDELLARGGAYADLWQRWHPSG
jgi:ATP-binding cassette subfamily C protein